MPWHDSLLRALSNHLDISTKDKLYTGSPPFNNNFCLKNIQRSEAGEFNDFIYRIRNLSRLGIRQEG